MYLETIDFKRMRVPDFDRFLAEVESPANTLVRLNNTLQTCLTATKDVAAIMVGALSLDLQMGPAQQDTVLLLSFDRADKADAPAEELAGRLKANPAIQAADAELCKAYVELVKAAPAGLRVENNELAGGPVEKFNTCLR